MPSCAISKRQKPIFWFPVYFIYSCRLHGVPFLVAFFTPVTVIIVGNIVAFCFIIRSILTSGDKVTSVRKASGYQQARQGIAIMVLLGLTWLFGILAINDAKIAFQYLFSIFNTLQGLFVFLLFCVLPTGTRRQLLSLYRKNVGGPRRESELPDLSGRNVCNNLTYSSDASTARLDTNGLQVQSLSSENSVEEAPLKNSSNSIPVEKESLHEAVTISKEIFLNPNITRYSVRKNGSNNYVTTIELNLQSYHNPTASVY